MASYRQLVLRKLRLPISRRCRHGQEFSTTRQPILPVPRSTRNCNNHSEQRYVCPHGSFELIATQAFWESRFRARWRVWSRAALVFSYSCCEMAPCLCSTSSWKSSSLRPSKSIDDELRAGCGRG